MTFSHDNHPEAGLLRMLREALRAGLAPGADDEAFAMACSAAQIVGLRGLEASLAALSPHRGGAWQGEAAGVVERLHRLAGAAALAEVRAADEQLFSQVEILRPPVAPGDVAPEAEEPAAHGLRAAGGGTAGADPADEEAMLPPPGMLTVAEALADLPLAGDGVAARASRVWLSPHVAAALRAALEWLSHDAERPRPFRLRAEDSVLEVVCEGVDAAGLMAAHEALAEADGSLAPLGETSARAASGAWLVRVPAWSANPVHLMLEQGHLRLAVPWHSVLRLSLVPSIEIEMRGGSLATPVLAPLAPLVPGVGERPVVAIAHGLKRALLVADRLVWRLGAQPCEPVEPAPADSLSVTVCSDEGEIFWVAQPRVLLRDVALPALPPPEIASGPRPARPLPGRAAPAEPEWMVLRAEDVEPLTLEAADVEPIGLIATAAPAAPDAAIAPHATVVPAATIAAATHPSRLLPEWLERFGTAGASARAISGVEPEAPMPAPASTPAAGPAVLIAEDSFAARHFLTRMFEQRGLAVRGVDSAAALRQALAESPWSLVCVDIELPDGRGREWLEEMRAALEARDVPLVVLVRDDEDTEIAAASGVGRWLRKPFDRDEIDHLLSRLGLGAERLT